MAGIYESGQAGHHMRDILDAALTGQCSVISRYGKPVAAVIPWEHYAALYLGENGENANMAGTSLRSTTEGISATEL